MKHKIILLLLAISISLNIFLVYQQNQQNKQLEPEFRSYVKVMDMIKRNLNKLTNGVNDNDEELISSTKGMIKALYLLYPEVVNTPEAAKFHVQIFNLYDKGEYNEIKIQISDILKILKPTFTSKTSNAEQKEISEKLNAYYQRANK